MKKVKETTSMHAQVQMYAAAQILPHKIQWNWLKGYLAGDSLTASTKLPLSSDTTG